MSDRILTFKSINGDEFKKHVDKFSIVIVTVTLVEKESLHERIAPLPGQSEILIVQEQFLTYFLCSLGKYAVCHVESKMGSIGAGASIMTVQHAIEFIKPEIIIMVGIAFGVDPKEQNIGDVLISEQIIQYETLKYYKNGKVRGRGFKQMANPILLNRFANPIGWTFKLSENINSQIKPGNLLSGEKLIDNITYRNQLIEVFGPAIGGEMEGAGLVSVANTFNKPWLVVKGICDFADGKKSVDKEGRQKLAANAAVDLCFTILNDAYTFKDLRVFPLEFDIQADINPHKTDMEVFRHATFSAYSEADEFYYYERKVDRTYNGLLEGRTTIWAHGNSGLGKTCTTYRNVIRSNKKSYVIDLSSEKADNILSVLEFIDYKLLKTVGIRPRDKASSVSQSLEHICEDLNMYYPNSYVVFEEIPIDETNIALIESFFHLMIKNINNYPNSTTKFAFTSINNPLNCGSGMIDKISEQIQFVEFTRWNYQEMRGLIDLITNSISYVLDECYTNVIISSANGNPRTLKGIVRKLVFFVENNSQSLKSSLVQFFKSEFGYVQ